MRVGVRLELEVTLGRCLGVGALDVHALLLCEGWADEPYKQRRFVILGTV